MWPKTRHRGIVRGGSHHSPPRCLDVSWCLRWFNLQQQRCPGPIFFVRNSGWALKESPGILKFRSMYWFKSMFEHLPPANHWWISSCWTKKQTTTKHTLENKTHDINEPSNSCKWRSNKICSTISQELYILHVNFELIAWRCQVVKIHTIEIVAGHCYWCFILFHMCCVSCELFGQPNLNARFDSICIHKIHLNNKSCQQSYHLMEHQWETMGNCTFIRFFPSNMGGAGLR